MKLKDLLLLMLFLPASLFAQKSFFKKVTFPSLQSSLSIAPGKDSSLYFFSRDSYYGMMDKNGALVWAKLFVNAGNDFHCRKLIRISDTLYAAIGELYNSYDGAVVLFDHNGVIKATKSYNNPNYEEFDDLMVMSQKRYLILEYGGSSRIKLIKTNTSLNTILSKQISVKSIPYGNSFSSPSICLMNSNLFLLTYSASSYLGAELKASGTVTIALDSSLSILWTKTTEGDYDASYAYTTPMDNRLYIASGTTAKGVGKKDIMLTCLDTLGNELWCRTWGNVATDESASAITWTSDTCLLIAGVIENSTTNKKGLLMKVDKNGELIWAHQYNPLVGSTSMLLNQVIHFSDSLIGAQFYSGGSWGFMVLTESGNAGCLVKNLALQRKSYHLSSSLLPVTVSSFTPTTGTALSYTTAAATVTLSTVCQYSCEAVANMRISSTKVCMNDSIHLQNISAGAISHSWLLDGSAIGNAPSMNIAFAVPGYHTLSLVAYGSASCSDTLTAGIYVDSLPQASFTSSQKIMEGYFISNSISSETDTWIFGDDNLAFEGGLNENHVFSSPGTYSNCLVASNVCGTDTFCSLANPADHSNYDYYSKIWGQNTSNGYGSSICQNPMGELVIAGWDPDLIGGTDVALLFQLKHNGMQNKMKIMEYLNFENDPEIYALKNGSYLILLNNSGSSLLALMDSVFSYPMVLNFGSVGFNCAAEAKDGSLFFGGKVSNKGVILKTSSSMGHKIWANQLAKAMTINSLCVLADGNLLLAGRSTNNKAYLSKMNGTTGQLIWSKFYTSPSSTLLETKSIFYDKKSGSVYLSGFVDTSGNKLRAFLIRADTSGAITWSKIFRLGTQTWALDCFTNQYNKVFVGMSNPLPPYRNFLAELDTSGNILHIRNYRMNIGFSWLNTHVNSFIPCYDGGVAMIGNIDDSNINDSLFIVKTDTSGMNHLCNITSYSNPPSAIALNLGTEFSDSTSSLATQLASPAFSMSYPAGYVYPQLMSCSGGGCSSYLVTSTSQVNSNTYTFTYTLPPFPVNTMQWNFGDGTFSDSATVTHSYLPGNYTATLSVDISGCGILESTYNISVPTSLVSNSSGANLEIIPNPASSVLVVKNNIARSYSTSLKNVIGEELWQGHLQTNSSSEIDVSRFSEGVYFLSVVNVSEKFIYKIILKH